MARQIANILFVCTGNICRSSFAEGLFTQVVGRKGLKGVTADSAGLLALPGNSATYLAQRVATEHGVDLAEHEAKSVSKDLVAWSDLILVMEKSHQDALLPVFPEAAGKILLIRHFARFGSRRRGIADPYGLDYDAYRFCFLDIEDAISGLIEFLGSSSITFEAIRVSSYAGYKSNESPRSFVWGERVFNITRIVDHWYDGSVDARSEIANYFKVQADDGGTYIIRYNRLFDSWAVLIPESREFQ
ncbi:MAG: low molecular weight protein arginine phosphatase [Desulfobacterales bacterium]|nr:low molecular weight protein arginine phosphatase [Desulfobacterales bacterium]